MPYSGESHNSQAQREMLFGSLVSRTAETLQDEVLVEHLGLLGVDFQAINSTVFVPNFTHGKAFLPEEAVPNGVALLPILLDEISSRVVLNEDLLSPTQNRVARMLSRASIIAPEDPETLVNELENEMVHGYSARPIPAGALVKVRSTVWSGCAVKDGLLATPRPVILVRGTEQIGDFEAVLTNLHEYVHAADFESREFIDRDINDRVFRAFTELRAYYASEVLLRHYGLLDTSYAKHVHVVNEIRRSLFGDSVPSSPEEISGRHLSVIHPALSGGTYAGT